PTSFKDLLPANRSLVQSSVVAGSKSLNEVGRLAYLRLMEKYQEFNPFKFIIYLGKVGIEITHMKSPRSD
ncbi:MAG TPA: hypothetical protein VHJ19_13815, partial [Gammaproteobacteria bacterium]|nr:hypothetical protein [Gammaproteobacteria bacterium]